MSDDGLNPPPRSRNAESLRRLRAAAVVAGDCQECRARPAKAGRKTCEHCLEVKRNRKAKRRAAGLCPCGKRRARGLSECRACLDIGARSLRRNRARARIEGRCTWHGCHDPAKPGRSLCEPHTAANAARTRSIYRARKEAA